VPFILQLKDLKVVFDLDDTLIMTMVKFNHAAFECGRIVVQALGWYAPYAPDIMALQVKLDIELTEELGFGPTKYATCWLKTYETLCDERALIPDEDVKYRLQRAARRPFTPPFDLVPGALDVVKQIAPHVSSLDIITMGEEPVQKSKVFNSPLLPLFSDDRIHAVQENKITALAAIAGNSPERTVMIGDSKKSDITAAQAVGAHPILVECPTHWSFNNVDDDKLGPYWSLSCIKEVPATLERIMRGASPP